MSKWEGSAGYWKRWWSFELIWKQGMLLSWTEKCGVPPSSKWPRRKKQVIYLQFHSWSLWTERYPTFFHQVKSIPCLWSSTIPPHQIPRTSWFHIFNSKWLFKLEQGLLDSEKKSIFMESSSMPFAFLSTCNGLEEGSKTSSHRWISTIATIKKQICQIN